MSILTWLSQLCNIHIIKVVTICSLPSIHILIPDISRIELHIDLTELLLPINIILVHLCDTAHASIAVSIYISQRIGNYLLSFFPSCVLYKKTCHRQKPPLTILINTIKTVFIHKYMSKKQALVVLDT